MSKTCGNDTSVVQLQSHPKFQILDQKFRKTEFTDKVMIALTASGLNRFDSNNIMWIFIKITLGLRYGVEPSVLSFSLKYTKKRNLTQCLDQIELPKVSFESPCLKHAKMMPQSANYNHIQNFRFWPKNFQKTEVYRQSNDGINLAWS